MQLFPSSLALQCALSLPPVRVPLYVLLALGGGDHGGCGFWTQAPVQARLFLFFFFPPGVRSPEGLPKTLEKWLTSLLAARCLLRIQFADEAAVHPIPSCRIRISTALARQCTAERLGASGPSTLSRRLRKGFSSQASLAAGASTGSGASRYRMTHRQPHSLTWFGVLVLCAISFVR